MSVYIKGMEMPTSCRACMFSRTDIRNVDWCVLTEKDLPCDCPLVPVPKHGRLIDADAMIHDIKKAVAPTEYIKNRNSNMVYFLQKEETIIPASEEGE